jgi:hypothetical protein
MSAAMAPDALFLMYASIETSVQTPVPSGQGKARTKAERRTEEHRRDLLAA